jgi:peptide/nickel transport system ATP-binding protein
VPGRRRRGAAPRPDSTEADERGCPYAARCAFAEPRCREEAPALRPVGERHRAACHLAEAILGKAAASDWRGKKEPQ